MQLNAHNVVLVTGGTGTFGHAVVERLLKTEVGEIRVFSRDEKKQEDMRLALKDPRVKYIIGDVRDYQSVYEAMEVGIFGVDYVFHAAALKQVPSCEFHPLEAFKTNVLGAENVMRAAIEKDVRKCVLLSTDKAVYPANAMGMSKAMMEKIMVARSRKAGNTVLCATRYGNVVGSRGSVVPLFVEQLRKGEPLTVTEGLMTRFVMTAEESVDLVLYAFEHGRPGDIFVKKAPACDVDDLVTALAGIFQCDPIVHTIGTRPGEKSCEFLVSPEEMGRAEDLGRYYRIPADAGGIVPLKEGYSSDMTRAMGEMELIHLLKQIPCVKEALRA
ncbi:MAG TPA: SDR family NAD(P)-dependent oxidoreductase [Stellaceae bacterium]|nr:SDR family NAD(P)-dependent oxidoreductase [Terriglobia bacterium]HEV2551774.1 SDR family NAD(P)-dependent oxidoreductase [Stellaceae bacterium]